MATAKNTTTKKTASKPKTAPKVEQIAVEEAPTPVPAPVQPKTYGPSDLIIVRSITQGKLVHIGKRTGTKYIWANAGDIAWMEYQDVMASVLSKSSFAFKPYFVIEDEELLKSPQCRDLNKLYGSLYEHGDILALMELPLRQFKEEIKKLPIGMRNALKSAIVTGLQEGTFDSVQKINAVDEEFGTDIKSLIG